MSDDPHVKRLLENQAAMIRNQSFAEEKVHMIEALRKVHEEDRKRIIGEVMLGAGMVLPAEIRKFFGA
ncbi:hypothetical protein [Bradyrhizobium genosp. A]|uniref:hypothetical protein n=1 Tax=Bradyrhizobium genosp. A TaxID=83626 RepID=UPI003CEE9DEF